MVDTFNFESSYRYFKDARMVDFKTSDGTEWKLTEEWFTAQKKDTIMQRIVFCKQNYYDRYYIVNVEITSLTTRTSGKLQMAKGSGPIFTSITIPLDQFKIFRYVDRKPYEANGVNICAKVLKDKFRYKVTISRAYDMQGEGDQQEIPARDKLLLFSDQIHSLLETGNFSDVILTNGHFQVRAHRNVLCARSEYFRTMFSSKMVEGRDSTIYLGNISEEILKELLQFIYSGVLRYVETSTASELLKVAEMMHLEELKSMCCRVMEKNITLSNADEILHLAHSYEAEDLKAFCLKFAVENFGGVEKEDSECEICLQLVNYARQADREYVSYVHVD